MRRSRDLTMAAQWRSPKVPRFSLFSLQPPTASAHNTRPQTRNTTPRLLAGACFLKPREVHSCNMEQSPDPHPLYGGLDRMGGWGRARGLGRDAIRDEGGNREGSAKWNRVVEGQGNVE